ncbi:hypothetical protein Poli38472_012448 [Pythium oligandrum]|uniref:PX domain-containing protein n=1 Tax=Pythium oligandrum TaxID=41045 RepID=A0A8K1CRF4_PYTOL|nr:hypothetical protein Poli38472_012448 [Pythium oligandrum]|eukprot:TMW67332.1 hypothetical protein Poli38472_012448 [Pythium oligandrum]
MAETVSTNHSSSEQENKRPASLVGSVLSQQKKQPTANVGSVENQQTKDPTHAVGSVKHENHVDNRMDSEKSMESTKMATPYEHKSSLRKRMSRRHGSENMFALAPLFSRDLRITGVSKKGSSWRYHIEVLDIRISMKPRLFNEDGDNNSNDPVHPELPPVVRYSVMRRYNDFRQLYLHLVDIYSPEVMETLPAFPDGGLFTYFRGDDPKLLQYRKEQLQRFLRAMDENEDTKWCRAFMHFLRPDLQEITTLGGRVPSDAAIEQPPSSFGFSRVNTTAGYVSLSCVKSPEIRFKQQPMSGRGDWKRRRIEQLRRTSSTPSIKKNLYSQLQEAGNQDHASPSGSASRTGNEDDEDDDDDDDDDEDDDVGSQSTELMKLLCLDPPK